MTDHDDHIQHTWNLTHPTGDQIRIHLWANGTSVRVDGGNHESTSGGRKDIDRLLEKYALRGYWVTSECSTCPTCGFCRCDNHTCKETPVPEESHRHAIDALRHAIRTRPTDVWDLTTAHRAMVGTPDYDRIRANHGGHSWTFVEAQQAALAREGWLTLTESTYVAADAARSTWPTDKPTA